MNVLPNQDRFVDLLRRGLHALELLAFVAAPMRRRSRDVSTVQSWGPFDPGQVLRVTSSGNAWFYFGTAAETISGDGDGSPIAAWDRQDFVVPDEKTYAFVLKDSGASAAFADVYPTGRRSAV